MLAGGEPVRFHIGINFGDVMINDGDIFGDDINIAARPENLATPGGICISRGVREHLRKIGRFASENLGEQSVKNIKWLIRAFRVRLSGGCTTTRASSRAQPRHPPNRTASPHHRRLTLQPSRARTRAGFLRVHKGQPKRRGVSGLPRDVSDCTFETRRSALLEEAESADKEPDAEPVELAYWDTMKDSDNPDMSAPTLSAIRRRVRATG